jgi:hypothetical protein
LTGAVNETEAAFAGLSKAPFMDETKNAFTAWSRLVDLGASRARDTLLESLKQGKINDEYFSVYTVGPGGLRYWNDLIINGLTTLMNETQGDLQTAKSGLVNDGKGVPLVLGPADMKDVSPATVKKLKGASDKLDALASADKSAAGTDKLPPEIKSLMLKLAGADIFPDPASRAWFTKLKGVLKVLGTDKQAGALVSYSTTSDKPKRPGLVDDVRDNYRYAGLWVGGMVRGDVFNLTLEIPAAKQAALRVDVPLMEGQTTEIYLYKESPDVAGNIGKPDAKIVLPGPWSLVRQICCEDGEAERDEKTGQWRVLTTTTDKKMYLWVNLKFVDQDLPLKSDWPRADQWPTP